MWEQRVVSEASFLAGKHTGGMNMEGAASGEQMEMSQDSASWEQEMEALLGGEADMMMR